jgi:hypothetical protein
MLVMKAWLETRWRLLAAFTYLMACLAFNYQSHNAPAVNRGLLIALGTILACGSVTLAGSGVKSQAPVGFPEGLAGSTQFTISLPVSRRKLLAVRAGFGMLETIALTLLVGCLAWVLYPSLRASATQSDFLRLLFTTILFLSVPYCAAVFFETFVPEPLSLVFAGWTITLLLWLAHHIAPAVDIVRAWGPASPLITHQLPWSQLASCAVLGLVFVVAALRVVRTREY